jgi:tRNA (guanine37-N1)-methyltransferase
MMWRATILTLFPEMFPGLMGHSLAGKALARSLWQLETVDIRTFATDRHGTVDDTPFGGGAGMVMRPDIVDAAIRSLSVSNRRLLVMSPRGQVFEQKLATELSQSEGVTLLCGRYEGIDQRVIDAHGATEISVGDYVLSGGETAAMVILDACVRLLPGVMGNEATVDEESFANGLLEYPHYTRPASWQDAAGVARTVPEILLSGHHEKIKAWRLAEAERVTREKRPDLWQQYVETSGKLPYKTPSPGKNPD